MLKLKIQQLGLAICGLALLLFGPIHSDVISIVFFGEPEFPEET